MAIIPPPAPLPLRNVKWRAPFPAQVNRSGWTGTRKVVGLPGATVWTASGEFVTIVTETNAKRWRAWFMSLRGSLHSFPMTATETQQTTAANPVVRAGGNAGVTVPLEGLPANATALVAGDMLTVPLQSGHRRLVVLTADLVTNGNGQGTASFVPELAEVPLAGAIVEIQRPYALMAQTSEAPGWDVAPGQMYAFTLSAEEAR